MRQVIKFTLIGILVLSFVQCEKNDLLKSNSIKMDGSNFLIVSASMVGVSIGDNGHTGISLVSGSALQVKTLTIDVKASSEETIEGEYAYPEENGKKLIDSWLTNYSAFNGTSMTSTNLESGQMNITHNEDKNYTVELNLILDDGVTFTGTYTGDFQVMFNNQ